LGEAAPERGVGRPRAAAESIMIAPWPESDATRRDPRIEARFARFQDVLRAVRDIRGRQNVSPKVKIDFAVRCDEETAELLEPMTPYFESMAGARATGWGAAVEPPALSANVTLPGAEVFVDLAELIDVDAEIAKQEAERTKLDGLIAAKLAKLANEKFVSRAPAAVIEKERDALGELEARHAAAAAVIGRLSQR
jgi:valyl-tRNA synthetase